MIERNEVKHTTPESKATTVRKPNRKPSIKQQKTVVNLLENGGNVSKAMRDAGYSAAMAKNPQKFTESEYVQAMMAEVGLTDVDGFQLLKEGMAANKTIVMGGEQDSFVDIQPDFQTRHKYLETFMKLRGLGRNVDNGSPAIHFHNHTNDKKEGYSF